MLPHVDYKIDAWRHGSEILAEIGGRLTQSACAELKQKLNELLTPAVETFYVSLAGLDFIDSSGLGALIGLKMEANRSHSMMILLRPAPRIIEILRVSRLDGIFEIVDGIEAEMIVQNMRKTGVAALGATTGDRPSLTPSGNGERPAANLNLVRGADEANESRTRQLCNDAVEYLRQGNLTQAMNAYQRALQIDPENVAVLNNLGVVCEKRPEWYQQGREVWETVLELSRRNNDEKHIARAQRHLDMLGKLIRTN